MTKEISLSFLIKILKAAWLMMLIAAVVLGAAVAAFTEFFIPKKYVSSVEFYIINTQAGAEYTQMALLSASERLATDYVKIIMSDEVVSAVSTVAKDKGYDVSESEIRSMISSQVAAETSTFTISVTTTDPQMSYDIVKAVEEKAPDIIRDITRPEFSDDSNYYKPVRYKVDENGKQVFDKDGNPEYVFEKLSSSDFTCVSTVRTPSLPTAPSSPNVKTYTLLAAVIAAFVVYAVIFIIKIADTTIRSKENVTDVLDPSIIVIGEIPEWYDSNVKKSQGGEAK